MTGCIASGFQKRLYQGGKGPREYHELDTL